MNMVSTADFSCVSIDGKTALVHVSVAKDGKDEVQCMVPSKTVSDCTFLGDQAACETYRKSNPPLAMNCTGKEFCAKVPAVLKNATVKPVVTLAPSFSKGCSRNGIAWACSVDPETKLVVLVGIVNGTINCNYDPALGICNVYSTQDICTTQCAAFLANPAMGMKPCESTSTGYVCPAAHPTSKPPSTPAIPSSGLPTVVVLIPASMNAAAEGKV